MASARAVGKRPPPARTNSGSLSRSRKRASAWLVADWLSPTRAAARVTLRSSSRAWSTTARFRSIPAICAGCIIRMITLHWANDEGARMLIDRSKETVVMTFAIAGVSGHTGRVAAEALLAQGKQVRVIVREREKAAALAARG